MKAQPSSDVLSCSLAISLAGHLGLDNLILIYDNNSVTVDGNIDACFSEDTSAKLKAQGWHVIEVDDGSNDVSTELNSRRYTT